MKVELYLKNINQEMIDAGKTVPHRDAGIDSWTVSWPKECCVLDFSITKPWEKIINPAYRGYIMRQEKEGGMIWDPKTGAVYKVDEEAYHTLLELNQGASVKKAASRMKIPVSRIQSLVKELKSIQKTIHR